jgi:multidrug efflux pump subunit AcrA (membrane-fusion protein)
MHAVFQREGNEFVWVLNADSTVSSRKVEMSGIDDDGDAVIVSGLTGEETIVRAGANTLQEGEKVKVISVTTETNVGGML